MRLDVVRAGQAEARARELARALAERGAFSAEQLEQLREGEESPTAEWLERAVGDPTALAEVERELELAEIVAGVAELSTPPEVERAAAEPERRLGRYVLVERLGAGSFAEVHRAWDRVLSRWVAIKRLHDVDPEGGARFLREGRVVARLDHPGIVRVLDAGVEGDRPWLAMELVEGSSLEGARLDRRRAAAAVRDAARAVSHAHDAGVVHRDLKPANLLVDGRGEVRVTDFGIARSEADAGATVSGELLGTPAFMAPEQASGERAGPAADVWALGATLYALVEGRPPYAGENLIEVVVRASRERPPRLGGDDDLVAVAERAMERHPHDRYPTAAALADDLDRYLGGEGVSVRPRSAPVRLLRRMRRRPLRSGIAVLLVAAAAGAASWGVIETRRAHRRERAAATAAPALATARSILDQVERLQRSQGGDRALLERARADLDRATASALELAPEHAPALELRARALIADERGAEAEAVLDRLVSLSPGDPDVVALRAYARWLQVELPAPEVEATRGGLTVAPMAIPPSARATLERAAEDWRALPADHPDRRFGEAVLAFVDGDAATARRLLLERLERRPFLVAERRILAFAELILGDYPAAEAAADVLLSRGLEEGIVRSLRGYARAGQGDLEGAVEDMTAALDLYPEWTPARGFLAFWLFHLGRYDQALVEIDRAVAEEPDAVSYRLTRCMVRWAMGDLTGAEEEARKAIALEPENPEGWYNLGAVTSGTERAVPAFDRALELAPGHVAARGQRALARLQVGDPVGAESDARAAAEAEPDFASWWWALAIALAEQGRPEEAERAASSGLERSPENRALLHARGIIRVDRGDCAGAAEDLARLEKVDPAWASELAEAVARSCP